VDLFNSPVLVYDQPPEMFSVEAKYTIWNPQGHPVANVAEQGVNGAQKAWRVLNQRRNDQAKRDLLVTRPDGMPYFWVNKPYSYVGTPKIDVVTPQGQLIGHLRKRALQGYEMIDAYQRQIGYFDYLRAQVTDWQNIPIATFRRTGGAGDRLAQMFSGADRYVLQLNFQLPEPIRTLTLACPLAYDTTRSSNRGLGGVLGV
jgi:hypothetical protein